MASFKELKRRSLLPAAAVALALYYLFVFVPLARRAERVNEPLDRAWQKLAGYCLDQTNATALDFSHITNQLSETRQALAILEKTKRQAATRLDLPPRLRARLSSPFQLVDFQYERNRRAEDLDRQCKQQQIAVDPLVFTAFPEHTADIKEPALLWGALALTDDVLETAVRCKVSAIHALEVNLPLTNAAPWETQGRWAEIAVQVEFSAPADNAARVLRSLPLRAEEIKAAGLPQAAPQKLPLFIDRFIMRKETPEKLDEVRVWVRAVGFLLREPAREAP